jgi:hypothetical protein
MAAATAGLEVNDMSEHYEPSGTCNAAIPLTLRDYTGRMVGGDPVIETETVTDYWAECGQPSAAVHVYRCEHGHEVRKETCPEHEPKPGTVGCRQCYDQGHECGMQAVAVT